MKKLLVAIAAVLVLAGGATGLYVANQDDPKQAQQSTQTDQSQKSTQTSESTQSQKTKEEKTAEAVTYKGVEGKNALELLKASHKVETKTYEGMGELVTSIDGVTPDSKHFWAFYVNGQQSQVGASSYTTKATDNIEWKLEEIQ
jgi:uncharacterized protein YxeA